MRLESDTVPAILAIKRFVRRTLKQVSISVLSLMLVVGMATHSAAANTVVEVKANRPTTHTQRTRPVRMVHASVLHHHLTGARLSTAAIAHHTRTQKIADAK